MGSGKTSNGLNLKDLQGKYVRTKSGQVGLVNGGIGDTTYVMYHDDSYDKCKLKELTLLEQGKIDYGSNRSVPCCLEFVEDEYGKQIILHIPNGKSVTNIFHSITVKGDLLDGGVVVQKSPFREITDWGKIKKGDTIYYKGKYDDKLHKKIFRERDRMGDIHFHDDIDGYLPASDYTFYIKVVE